MKLIFKITPILLSILMVSCVSRIDLPEDAELKLVVNLEMLRGEEITATLQTSGDLNGNTTVSYPIEHPEDAEIAIYKDGQFENVVNFYWDQERELYVYAHNPLDILHPNWNLVLNASIPGKDIAQVTSRTKVPTFNMLVQEGVTEEKYVTNEEGEEFWEGTVRLNFMDLNTTSPLYYQIFLNERYTLSTGGEDPEYTHSGDLVPYEIVSINSGSEAIKEFGHKEGLFVDLEKLESEYFEFTLRSNFPRTETNQVSDHIYSSIVSITRDHYFHHLGIHNIETNNNSIFGEPALYRSNISNGLGLFSSCVKQTETILLKK